MVERKHILVEEDEGLEWVAVYLSNLEEYDDDFESSNTKEVKITAPDFDTAVRYAQQYLRKMQSEEETASEWKTVELVSVQLY